MPPVTVAITATLVSAGVGAATAGFIASSIVTSIVSAALSFVTGALAGKPESPDFSSFTTVRSRGATQQFRQPVTERKIVYGDVRTSGAILYAGVTNSNKYLHLVIEIATHEIEEIGEIFINDLSVPPDDLDGSGFVQSGRYADKVRIKKYLGTTNQTADADLVAEVPEWTTDHRLQGIAYVYVRMEWDRDVFTSGIPNVSFWVKGAKAVDPRDSSSPLVPRWTPNAALLCNEYLTNTYYGLSAFNVDQDELIGAANTCEEFVSTANLDVGFTNVDTSANVITLSGDRLQYQTGDRLQVASGSIGGISAATDYYVIAYQRKETPRIKLANSLDNAIAGVAVSLTSGSSGTLRKNAEPRYFAGGVLKMSAARGENLKDVLSAMSGQAVYAGGKWRLLAGEYQTPTISFDEGDLAGAIEVSTKVSERERFNRVQGVFVSPLNDGNPTDYPLYKNDTYATQDGKVIKKNLDFPFTQRAHTAQRIAKLQLERMRQEIIFTANFKLTAFKVQVGDNFYFSFDRYGWDQKVFEVISWTLFDDNGAPAIAITARENASAVYDWNSGEETAVDPAPNTSLSNPFIVPVVTGFSLDSFLVNTKELDRIFSVMASWDAPDDSFVLSGGFHEIEYKITTESVYNSAGKVDGDVTEMILPALRPDVLYDIRIFAYNNLNAKSAETVINNFQVGTSITTDTEDWENESLARDGDDWEVENLTAEDWET